MRSEEKMVGRQFATHRKLREYLEEYQRKEQEMFTVDTSETLPPSKEEAHLRIAERQALGPVYRKILYCCKFGGKAREAGTGIRRSSTFNQNCGAKIRVGLSKDQTMLEIKAANLTHCNHPASKVFFNNIPENRRLSPQSQKDTLEALAMGCNKKLVQVKLLEEKKKHVTLKYLSNLKSKLKNVDEDSLQKAVKLLENKYGATVKILEEEKKFKGLFFVTEAMKTSMWKWYHIVFIDGTYKLIKSGLTLMLLIVQDSNALSAVVGVALLASEDRPTFTWLLQSFKDVNSEACAKIHCFMSDKDLLERDVLKEVFPGKPVYICRFHTLRTFSRTITATKMNISEDERRTSLELLQKMVYSSSESKYNKLYKKFVETVPTAVAEYFNLNWHSIREDWTAYSMVDGNLNNLTNNRLESMNAKIKQVVQKNSSLVQFIENFFKWLQSHNLGVGAKTANTLLKRPVEKFAPDCDQQQYRHILMPPSAARVVEQIGQCQFVTNITCTDQKNNHCTIRSNGVDLRVTPQSCECAIWTSEFVPCRHIFSVRKYFNLPLFSSELCQARCTKQYLMETLQCPTIWSPSGSTKNLSTPSVSKVIARKPVTATEKRKNVTPIITEMLNLAVGACGMRFESRVSVSVLKDICEAWRQGCEITILKSDGARQSCDQAASTNADKPLKDHHVSADINSNLSRLIDEQCTLSDASNDEMLDISCGSSRWLQSASTDLRASTRLTLPSDVAISDVKMPSAIKIFGRPSRHLATTPSVPKRKNNVKPFTHESDEQQIVKMMEWLIQGSLIDTVLRGEHLICTQDLQLKVLKDSIVDESVNLNLLVPYCEPCAFTSLTNAVATKKKRNKLKCGQCEKLILDNSVLCDHCLLWYHYNCANLSRAPKTKFWFCPQCSVKK